MKKLLPLIIIIISLLTFFSCSGNNNDGTAGNNGGESTVPNVVFNGTLDSAIWQELRTAIYFEFEEVPALVDDSAAKSSSEIVIGRTNRPISTSAYRALNKLQKNGDNDVAYVIYSDGNSLAMAYEDDRYGLNAALLADVNYFIENIADKYKGAILEKGIITKGVIDPIEYQRSLDEKQREEEWLIFEGMVGEDVARETKAYYAMFTNDIISWMADLYDSETGAFYFCNSGRNTEGYLPDIEATFHILSMFESSGMLDHLGGKYTDLPDWFLEKMATWVKDLQDPNGYFYHPQWGKDLTDTKPNRRGRDLNYGLAIMAAGGRTPTYRTPSGVQGDYTLSDGTKVDAQGNPILQTSSTLTNRLGSSAVNAVSKVVAANVVATATTSNPNLVSAQAFEAYLYSLDLRNDSYRVGNQLSNQVTEIKQRDKELGGELVRIMEKWLIEFQNPENGMWEWRSEDDPGYSDYDGVNGILKLLTLFNGLGIPYPNPIPAAESIIKSIYTDDNPPSVCQPYNAWYAMEDLFKNLRAHSKDMSETNRVINEIRERLRADAPKLIRLTAEKVSIFIKDDHSSSFAPMESSSTSQGMRVAVPHTNEGDTNATSINTFGTRNHMFHVLGWNVPSMFGKAEYYMFFDILENQGKIVKNEEPEAVPLDFEDSKIGSLPITVDAQKCFSEGDLVVIKDPTGSGHGNVFQLEAKGPVHNVLYIPSNSLNLTPARFVFESDYYISTEMEGLFIRLWMDEIYIINLRIYDGVISFSDSSQTNGIVNKYEQDLGFTANLDEWFNLRIEYYLGDAETVRIKIYLNGECVAVTDNYYDPTAKYTPTNYFNKANIELFTGTEATILLDNVIVHKDNVVYKEELDPDDQPYLNVDSPDREEIVHDFENAEAGQLPSDDIITDLSDGSSVCVVEKDGGKALSVTGSAETAVIFPINIRTKTSNVYSFETEITVNSIDPTAKVQILMYDKGNTGTSMLRLWLVPVTENGETYITMYEAAGGFYGLNLSGVKFRLGETVKIKVDFFQKDKAVLVYFEDVLVATSSALEAYAHCAPVTAVKVTNLASGAVDITLDNVRAERKDGSFDQATRPTKDSVIHGFDNGISEDVVISGAAVVEENGNKLVSFKNGGQLTIPANKRSVLGGAFVFSADVSVPRGAKDGDTLSIKFVDDDGNVIIWFTVRVVGTLANIYETTENGVQNNRVASIPVGQKTPVIIEYYQRQDIAYIYLSNVCAAATSVTYTKDSGKLEAARVIIESTNNDTEITMDNIVLDVYSKFFVKVSAGGSNSENAASKVTFETSSTGNIPTQFKADLRTTAAAVRIEEMIKRTVVTKALAFESSAGAEDKLYFAPNQAVNNGKVTVFETDMYLDIDSETTTYSIYLTNSSSKRAYLMRISFSEDGKLVMNDLTGESAGLVPGRIIGTTVSTEVRQQEWFKLRMEYYEGTHDTVRIKTYINDSLVYVSKSYYGRSTTVYGTMPLANVDRMYINTYGALVGTMYLDDLSVTREQIRLTDDPLTYTPKEAEPVVPNQEDKAPILTFEWSEDSKVPAPITREFASSGGAITVKEIVRMGVMSKVMAATTTADGGDKLFFAKTKTQSGLNAVEFSTKIAVSEMKSKTAAMYFYFRNGATVLNRVVLSVDESGNLNFSDYYNGTHSFTNAEGMTGLSASEWRTLTITLYSYNGSCRMKIAYGDFEIMSTNSSWSTLTPDKITDVRLDLSTASDMVLLLDDLSFQEKFIEIPREHEHTYTGAWTYDKTNHWHKASCSYNESCTTAVIGLEAHDYGESGVCICGAEKHEHTYSDSWSYDSENHWHKANCNYDSSCYTLIADFAEHIFDESGVCACGYEKPAVKPELGYFDAMGGYSYDGITTASPVYNTFDKTDLIDRLGVDSCDVTFESKPTTNHLSLVAISDTDFVFEIGRANTHHDEGVAFKSMGGSGDCLVFESDIYISNLTTLKFNVGFGYTGDAATTAEMLDYGKYTVTYKDGAFDLFGAAVASETWVNICVELYTDTGIIKYYVNGINTLTIEDAGEAPEISHFYFYIPGSNTKNSYIRLNDTYFGRVQNHLIESDEYYTFNDGKTPSNISGYFRGGAASLKVTDAPYLNTTESALTLISAKSNYNNLIYFKANENSGASKVVFETKYLMQPADPADSGSYFIHKFKFYSGSADLWQLSVYHSADGKLQINDYVSGGAGHQVIEVNSPAVRWVTFRFEGYVNDSGDFVVDVYLDGAKIMESHNTKWSATQIANINHVLFEGHNGFTGRIYFDDTKIVKE